MFEQEEISFTKEVKDEVSLLDLENIDYIKSLLSGFIKINGSLLLRNGEWGIQIHTENKKTAKLIQKAIKTNFKVETRIIVTEKRRLRVNKDNTIIIIEIIKGAKDMLYALEIVSDDLGFKTLPSKEILKDNECRRAYLAGCFLASGSVNSPKTSNYHLEMAVSDEELAHFLVKLLHKFYIDAKVIKRRNSFVCYIKRSEKIADFLRIIGAYRCLMTFENVRIQRDQYNSVNRVYNCDIANDMKSMKSGSEQLEMINYIDKMIGVNNLDDNLKELAKVRLANPEASLNEIKDIYEETTGKKISKSGIYHRFQKIKSISEKLKEGKS